MGLDGNAGQNYRNFKHYRKYETILNSQSVQVYRAVKGHRT